MTDENAIGCCGWWWCWRWGCGMLFYGVERIHISVHTWARFALSFCKHERHRGMWPWKQHSIGEHQLETDDASAAATDECDDDALMLYNSSPVLCVRIHFVYGAWWPIGRFDAIRPKGRGFESRSSRHVVTLGKSFTRSYMWRFGVKLRHSIRDVSGAPLSSSELEEAL